MENQDVYKVILKRFKECPIMLAIGDISRDFKYLSDSSLRKKEIEHNNNHFYLLGTMGAGMAVGFGLALSLENTKIKRVAVIEGDGGFLMGLNSLTTISYKKPKNLVVFLVNNKCYASTGGQPSAAKYVEIQKIVSSFDVNLLDVKSNSDLDKAVDFVFNNDGPHFVHIDVKYDINKKSPRVKFLDPPIITYKFCDFIEKRKQLFNY